MRGLKIAISGKGGVGKSTVAAVWSLILAQKGFSVLAIDADPDANLAHALGMPPKLQEKILPLSRQHDLVQARTGAIAGKTGQIYSLNPQVSDLASKYAINYRGVDLLVLGAIKKGGGGCACPESTLLRSLVRHCVLNDNEWVILDMEAGVEHLGRATASGVDALVTVTEAGSRSFETAARVVQLAKEIGLEGKISVLLNKVREGFDTQAICTSFLPGIPVCGAVPFDERFIYQDMQKMSLFDSAENGDLISYFEKALETLIHSVRSSNEY